MTEPNTANTTKTSSLSGQQLARAEALDRARSVLIARNLIASGNIEHPFELVGVARYIIDGVDVFNDDTADPQAPQGPTLPIPPAQADDDDPLAQYDREDR